MAVHGLKFQRPELGPLLYNPYQVAFIDALDQRVCGPCKLPYKFSQHSVCPQCKKAGSRSFHRFLLRAGRRGGKTRIGALAGIREAARPGTVGWICAPSFPELDDFCQPAFWAQAPEKWRESYSVTDRTLYLPHKSIVSFRSLDDPERGRGQGLDWLWIDEVNKLPLMAWEVIRPSLADKQGVAWFTSSPRGEDWVHELFWKTAERHVPGYWAVRYFTRDNPKFHSAEGKAEIDEARATMSPEMFRQEFEASIESFTGAIYAGLVNACVVDDIQHPDAPKQWIPEWPNINMHRKALFGLDPGTEHPFAGVLLVATPDALVVVGAYKRADLPAMRHAQNLQAMCKGLKPSWVCDRSQAQMIIELAQHGIYAALSDSNVEAGIERCKTWMLSGKLKILKSCAADLVSELNSYRWADTDRKDGAVGKPKPHKVKDDLCDALRYALMGWPELPSHEVKATGRDLSKLDPKMRADIERMARLEKPTGKTEYNLWESGDSDGFDDWFREGSSRQDEFYS